MNYPVQADVMPFLTNIVQACRPFAAAQSVNLLCEMPLITDEVLIEHITFFDSVFPKYEMTIDEITADGNRVTVRSRLKGRHEGVFGDIKPTFRNVEMPFVVSYEIENRKIISHWLIADQMALMEQLGAAEPVS